jgi:hypothetical protein
LAISPRSTAAYDRETLPALDVFYKLSDMLNSRASTSFG